MANHYLLFVDDETELLDMYREVIVVPGLEILVATSAEEALELYEEYGTQIKLIISDSNMPRMSGLDFLKNLRSKYETVPVFYLLTGAFQYQLEDVLQAGGQGLILKPFDLDQILAKIKRDLKL